MSQALVEVDDLEKAYREPGAATRVLTGASFTLARGEAVSMVGSSGVGKSTLLSILAGLTQPDAGTVRFDGTELTTMGEVERAKLRARRIGVVLQRDNLIPFLTAVENVELAMELAGHGSQHSRALDLLAELGLADRAGYLPRRLSGGEAQRAALAVALANEPDLLLADEVGAELDSDNARRVLELILAASRERGLTVLLVTHSPELAALAERCLRVVDGHVIEQRAADTGSSARTPGRSPARPPRPSARADDPVGAPRSSAEAARAAAEPGSAEVLERAAAEPGSAEALERAAAEPGSAEALE